MSRLFAEIACLVNRRHTIIAVSVVRLVKMGPSDKMLSRTQSTPSSLINELGIFGEKAVKVITQSQSAYSKEGGIWVFILILCIS